ncbi:MAG TPA: VOC family protein [Actinomycetota bacterium]|nr:VOC family protein [Actinomycetota bacterium]
MDSPKAQIWYVTVDCHDPDGLGAFWSKLLGVEVAGWFGSNFVFLERPSEDAVAMAFQLVPEDKVVKNRAHVDLRVDDLDAVSRWVEEQGGSRLADHEEQGMRWRVMADPEGNEFCLMPRSQP